MAQPSVSATTPAPAPAGDQVPVRTLLAEPQLRGTLIAGSERRAAEDALQIEASLARAALERGDAEGFARALHRIGEGMARLWPDSPELRALRAELSRLGHAPLQPDMPELGSTLRQLQAMREGRQAR